MKVLQILYIHHKGKMDMKNNKILLALVIISSFVALQAGKEENSRWERVAIAVDEICKYDNLSRQEFRVTSYSGARKQIGCTANKRGSTLRRNASNKREFKKDIRK
jgi:hypothetical protein